MKKQFISTFVMIIFLLSISLTLFLSPAKAAAPKIQFQYVVFPTTVYTGAEITLQICLINQGVSGQLIYVEGTEDLDRVIITIPKGENADDLTSLLNFSCSYQDNDPLDGESWICSLVDGIDNISLTLYPDGTVNVEGGETVCFNLGSDLNPVTVNAEMGLAFLNVDQQFDPSRADKSKNGAIAIFKTESSSAGSVEIDPTVNEDVKDGVDFTELTGTAIDAQIPDDITINYAADADTVDNKHYSDISQEIDDKIDSHENALGHLTIDQKTDLIDGSDTTLHYHASDRNLDNATGILDKSNLDSSQVQMRVTGTCGPSSSIREVKEDGSVVCEPDTDTHLSETQVKQWANEVDDVNDGVSNPSGTYNSLNVGYANTAGSVSGASWIPLCYCNWTSPTGGESNLACPSRCIAVGGNCVWYIHVLGQRGSGWSTYCTD